jgi:diguanylate cyclase (GGDEF)-like protein
MQSTISARLALPFALFLAPIAFLLFFLVQTHQRAISTAQNELLGLPPVTAAINVSRLLIQTAQNNEKRDELDQAVRVFRTSVGVLAHSPSLESRLKQLDTYFDELARLSKISIVDVVQALSHLARTIRAVADASELILDPDLDTYYYMEMLVVLKPDLLLLKRDILQDIMVLAANDDRIRPEGRQAYYYMRETAQFIERFDTSMQNIRSHQRSGSNITPSEVSGQRLTRALDELREAWAVTLDPRMIKPMFEQTMTLGALWQVEAAKELERLLFMRIAEIGARRNQQIGFALFMFLAAAAMMVWLTRRHVTQPVRRLTTSMIDLADGRLDVALPKDMGGGEVADMIRAVRVFKDNALRNRVLESEKREAATALSITANTLQRAEMIAGLGHWRWDIASAHLEWSPHLFDLTGFSARGRHPRLLRLMARVPRSERPLVVAYLRDVFRKHVVAERSFSLEHPEFGMRRLQSVVAIERAPQGHVSGLIGIVQDVTEQFQNEMKLQARSAALAEAQAIGRIGDWSYALGDSHVRWSPEIYALMCYEPAEFETTRQAIMDIYEGESAALVLQAQAAVIRTGETRSVDVRARLGDGSVSDFTVVSKADFDSAGRISGFSGTIQDISERKSAERELEKLAYYDPLTGLANRALFRRNLRRELDIAIEKEQPGALMLLDLDRFKEVNDSLGHAAGDELLVLVAGQLRRILPANAFLSRLGGDEFAVVIGDVSSERAAGIARTITTTLSEPFRLKLGEVQIGTSIGVAMMPADGQRPDDLIRNADLALYNAKDEGRSCLRFFTPKLSDAVQEKSLIARDLRKAIGLDDELFVVYQPQVDIQHGGVMGFEALLRWRHPERGLISPATFVPIAESSSLIGDLGLYVLRASCLQMKAWIDAGEPERDVAVNVSATQIWQSDFESDVKQVLLETGLPPHLLTLEVTESVFLREAEGRVRQSLEGLKALGVKLALDDFGTGYSSLGYLNRLPFDKLKVDRRFISGVHRNTERLSLLKGIIELGLGLGMTVVGEGAEHMEEVRALRALNCHSVQGYVFSYPLEGPSAIRAAAMLDLMVPPNREQSARKTAA